MTAKMEYLPLVGAKLYRYSSPWGPETIFNPETNIAYNQDRSWNVPPKKGGKTTNKFAGHVNQSRYKERFLGYRHPIANMVGCYIEENKLSRGERLIKLIIHEKEVKRLSLPKNADKKWAIEFLAWMAIKSDIRFEEAWFDYHKHFMLKILHGRGIGYDVGALSVDFEWNGVSIKINAPDTGDRTMDIIIFSGMVEKSIKAVQERQIARPTEPIITKKETLPPTMGMGMGDVLTYTDKIQDIEEQVEELCDSAIKFNDVSFLEEAKAIVKQAGLLSEAVLSAIEKLQDSPPVPPTEPPPTETPPTETPPKPEPVPIALKKSPLTKWVTDHTYGQILEGVNGSCTLFYHCGPMQYFNSVSQAWQYIEQNLTGDFMTLAKRTISENGGKFQRKELAQKHGLNLAQWNQIMREIPAIEIAPNIYQVK